MSASTRAQQPRQMGLAFRTWGGARAGAGRKPKGARAGVPHRPRGRLSRSHPVHVTLRVRKGVPKLRTRRLGRVLFAALAAARERFGMRLTHFSIQGNHLHLIVEPEGQAALSRALQGLTIRIAKRLNAVLRRRGSLFADRYHARALRTPLEVRRALRYVINNYRHHRRHADAPPPGFCDPFSSVDYFDGVRAPRGECRPRAPFALGRDPPVVAPRTWLLARGWRRHGLIDVDETP